MLEGMVVVRTRCFGELFGVCAVEEEDIFGGRL